MHDGHPAEPRRQRAGTLLLLLMIFALPLAVVTRLMVGPAASLPFGPQPGGTIRGRVLGPGGEAMAGHPVALELLTRDYAVTRHAERPTDGEGRFSFEAPPFDGKYRLAFGGDLYRLAYREVSLIDSRGRIVEVPEQELTLMDGAQLVLRFSRRDGRPVRGGRVVLDGTASGGVFFGLVGLPVGRELEFEGDSCVLGGLPPLSGEVHVFFPSGDAIHSKVRLPTGRTELSWTL